MFNYKLHCLICGDVCFMDIDRKNPNRWRRVVLCRTTDRGDQKTFKQIILDNCHSRHDDLGHQVKIRVMGAVSDLHAADARYHKDCMVSFMAPRSISAARSSDQNQEAETAISSTVAMMKTDVSHIWNSLEIYDMYLANGGKFLSRRALIAKLPEICGPDLLILSGVGVASLLLFRSKASKTINLATSEDDEDADISLNRIASKIKQECKTQYATRNCYQSRIDMDAAFEEVSPTLISLLSKVSHKLDHTLPAALIGNVVTNVITNRPTDLQIALAVLVSKKSLIEQMYDFRVTCSYDEVQRFKASAAKAAAINANIRGITSPNSGLVQVVADNFDANISSQNGLLSTHSLAVLLTMKDHEISDTRQSQPTIRRLTREEMKAPVAQDAPVQRYKGPKKPQMPADEAKRTVLSLRVLAHQAVQLQRARDLDFEFLKCITSDENVPEFGGFNTKLCREQGQSIQSATRAMYAPLIYMNPADPDTMVTAMAEAQRLTKECGQTITVFTNDKQLYAVAVNVMWVYQERFSQFIPRLGGMHMLMSFIGCVGHLMSESGLEDVMKAAFAGVPNMLVGISYLPLNTIPLHYI